MYKGFPDVTVIKNLPANAGDAGLIPGSGRSSGGGNGNPLQDSCRKNSLDREAWQATVHGVAKSWTEHAQKRVNVRRPIVWKQLRKSEL